jgi:hypothetical protein
MQAFQRLRVRLERIPTQIEPVPAGIDDGLQPQITPSDDAKKDSRIRPFRTWR